MAWSEHRRRNEVLRAVAEAADRRRDGLLPWDDIDGAVELFGTPEHLLAALQMRWYTRVAGSIDSALAIQPDDLESAVVHAVRYAAAGLPGIRAILVANHDHPAIAAGRRKELALLAVASGLTWFGDPHAVSLGRHVEERAAGVRVETTVRGAA